MEPNTIRPSRYRFTVLDAPEGFSVRMPTRVRVWPALFLPVWLALWLWGGFRVVGELLKAESPLESPLKLLWAIGWAAGAVWAVLAILWMIGGEQIVTLTPSTLVLRRALFGLSRNRRFDLGQIRRLRAVPQERSSNGSASLFGSTIAFDYGAKTIRFGNGAEQPEGYRIVEVLVERQPMLRSEAP